MASLQEFLNNYNTLDNLIMNIVGTKKSMIGLYGLTIEDPKEKATFKTVREFRNLNAHGVQPNGKITVPDIYINFLKKHIQIVKNPNYRNKLRSKLAKLQENNRKNKYEVKQNTKKEILEGDGFSIKSAINDALKLSLFTKYEKVVIMESVVNTFEYHRFEVEFWPVEINLEGKKVSIDYAAGRFKIHVQMVITHDSSYHNHQATDTGDSWGF